VIEPKRLNILAAEKGISLPETLSTSEGLQ